MVASVDSPNVNVYASVGFGNLIGHQVIRRDIRSIICDMSGLGFWNTPSHGRLRDRLQAGGLGTDPLFAKKHRDQVLNKLEMLETDPHPDGNTKMKVDDGIYRLRSGNYRIFYTFEQRAVGVVRVRTRNEKTYDDVPSPTMPAVPNLDVDLEAIDATAGAPPVSTPDTFGEPLPRPVDEDVLKAALVDEAEWPALMAVKTVDELLTCEGASTDAILAVVEILLPPPIEERLAEPGIVLAAGTESLAEIVEQDLDVRALLLELDEKQERFVSFALDGAGQFSFEGGQGRESQRLRFIERSGSSTSSRNERLISSPTRTTSRVLFTTYTNALVTFSADLLRHLLGSDVELVEVTTTDRVIDRVHRQLTGKPLKRTNPSVILTHLERSRDDLQSQIRAIPLGHEPSRDSGWSTSTRRSTRSSTAEGWSLSKSTPQPSATGGARDSRGKLEASVGMSGR